MFESKHNRSKQVANFTTAEYIVKVQIGTECDPFLLKSLENGVDTVPAEPTLVIKDDDSMTNTEKIKFKGKYKKYLNQVHKVNMQLKQTYSKYYG